MIFFFFPPENIEFGNVLPTGKHINVLKYSTVQPPISVGTLCYAHFTQNGKA